jgi:DNA-binding transcriptional MerR regulator
MMEYSSNKVAKMSGASARTLRYYDEIGLLKPVRGASSGYRRYGHDELDILQQILFYRELGFPLDEIKTLLSNPGFSREQAFENHLSELRKKSERLDALIINVTKSIAAMKGESAMSDNEYYIPLYPRLNGLAIY